MKDVKVLGPGCKRCDAAMQMVKDAAASAGIAVKVEKVTDVATIARYGVMATPGLVVDGKVVHAGGLPSPEDVARWIGD